jgi:hypothetical protein
MIVKEQYPTPTGRYRFAALPAVADWTVMIRDAKGSADGWYWAEIWDKQCADNNDPPYAMRNAGFGLYCTRCHAAAEKELTFSALSNIEGQPGQPLTYYDDNSWFYAPTPTPPPPPPCRETHGHTPYTPAVHHDPGKSDVEERLEPLRVAPPPVPALTPNPQFVAFKVSATLFYQSIPPHYLQDRFTQAPGYPATRRLYYLTSNLRTQGTPLENWKVKVVAATRSAGQ